MADAFISYKREDVATAARVAAGLAAEGYSAFYDRGEGGIVTGEPWDRRVERELAISGCCVVLWSPASVSSDHVRSEARRANARAILLPAFIARCEVPIGLDSLQAANLIGWRGGRKHPQWRYLIDSGVARLVGKRTAQPISPSSDPQVGSSLEPELGEIFVCRGKRVGNSLIVFDLYVDGAKTAEISNDTKIKIRVPVGRRNLCIKYTDTYWKTLPRGFGQMTTVRGHSETHPVDVVYGHSLILACGFAKTKESPSFRSLLSTYFWQTSTDDNCDVYLRAE